LAQVRNTHRRILLAGLVSQTAAMGFSIQACAGEFLSMLLFVFICVGTATGVAGDDGWMQQVALTFGFCIASLAYTHGHISGQINCAVTFGLVLNGSLSAVQGLLNFLGQVLGSLAGAALVAVIVSESSDKTNGLGTNQLAADREWYQAFVGECLMTLFLVYVVLETAVNEASKEHRPLARLAIGFAVYLAHSVMIPIDGCSINPTRSFGPAVVASIRYSDDERTLTAIWEHHWIFWVAPLLGAFLAVLTYRLIWYVKPVKGAETSEKVELEVPAPSSDQGEA